MIVSALVFAWKHAQTIHAKTEIDDNGSKIYEINGPIFFGSVQNFKESIIKSLPYYSAVYLLLHATWVMHNCYAAT